MTPKAQTSARLSTGLPQACSADMKAAVPRIIPTCVMARESVGEMVGPVPDGIAAGSAALASPKSIWSTALRRCY